MQKDIIFIKANEIYELFERDYKVFDNSKLRAINLCERNIERCTNNEDKLFWIDVKTLIKRKF